MVLTGEHRSTMSRSVGGMVLTGERRNTMSRSVGGMVLTGEHRSAMSRSVGGMVLTGEHRSTRQEISPCDSLATRTSTWTGLGLVPGATWCQTGN